VQRLEEEEGKICRTCGDWKPFSQYRRRAQLRDGYDNHCKVCKRAQDIEKSHGYVTRKPHPAMLAFLSARPRSGRGRRAA
jgi:hypothetical protein